jgi:hypothetical protein
VQKKGIRKKTENEIFTYLLIVQGLVLLRNITIDINSVVLACQYYGTVVHQAHIEALRMLNFAFEGVYKLTVLGEHGEIEVVVIVSYKHIAIQIDTDTDRIVGNTLATNLTQKYAIVVEHLDTMGPIVRYEYLLFVIATHAIGKLQVFRTVKLVQYIAELVEDNHAHDLAFHDNYTAFGVDAHAARMLQYVGTELAHKLSILVVDLYLMGGTAFGDDNVAGLLDDTRTIRIQQLAIAFAALAELELEAAIAVEYLYAMGIRVGHDDVITETYGNAGRLGELAVVDAELAELAIVDHLDAFQLGPGRYEWIVRYGRGRVLQCQVETRRGQ